MHMISPIFPPEVLVLMLAVAMLVGGWKLACGLAVGAIALALMPKTLAPWLDSLPAPLLMLITASLIVVILLAVLRLLANVIIGRNATDIMVGILVADAVRASARFVILMIWTALRGTWRLLLRPFRR